MNYYNTIQMKSYKPYLERGIKKYNEAKAVELSIQSEKSSERKLELYNLAAEMYTQAAKYGNEDAEDIMLDYYQIHIKPLEKKIQDGNKLYDEASQIVSAIKPTDSLSNQVNLHKRALANYLKAGKLGHELSEDLSKDYFENYIKPLEIKIRENFSESRQTVDGFLSEKIPLIEKFNISVEMIEQEAKEKFQGFDLNVVLYALSQKRKELDQRKDCASDSFKMDGCNKEAIDKFKAYFPELDDLRKNHSDDFEGFFKSFVIESKINPKLAKNLYDTHTKDQERGLPNISIYCEKSILSKKGNDQSELDLDKLDSFEHL